LPRARGGTRGGKQRPAPAKHFNFFI